MAEELLRAAYDDVEILILGRRPRLPPHVGKTPHARIRWVTSRIARLAGTGPGLGATATRPALLGGAEAEPGRWIRVHRSGSDTQMPGLQDVVDGLAAEPVLFEATSYDLYLEWPSTRPRVAVQTDIPGLLTPLRVINVEGGRTSAHYRLEIDDDVGILPLSLQARAPSPGAADQEIARLEIEVFPRKLDYQTDYRAMLREIGEIAPALVFEAAGRTTISAGLHDTSTQTRAEWYEILRAIAARLFQVVDLIARDPQRRLDPDSRVVPTERARRVRPAEFSRALRRSELLVPAPPGAPLPVWPRRIRENRAVPSFDAEGNRLLRWLLQAILSRLGRLERELIDARTTWNTTDSGAALAKIWQREIASLRPEIQRRLKMDWLKDVGEHNGQVPSSTLQAHPLYARALELGRALLRGLNADVPRFTEIGSRSAASLYEYWCFLAIVNILRRHGSLTQMSAIQMSMQGSRLSLKRGKSAAVVFRHRKRGTAMTVHYNRSYETPTVTQRPDASIHIETASEIYVFDAKYRLQFDDDYRNLYGGVGPRTDDISTMHRYRDAIVEDRDGSYSRVVCSACVLFPWGDAAAYSGHAFERSLDVVGIGGLPFLPGCVDLVAARLDRIVEQALGELTPEAFAAAW